LAAAVADDGIAVDRELVAPRMAAEIVVVVEDEDARVVPRRAAIEPRRRKPADAAADHDEVVSFFNGEVVDRIATPLLSNRMRHLERTRMLPAQPGERRRITRGIGYNLCGRREPRRNGQGDAVEKIAPGDALHGIR